MVNTMVDVTTAGTQGELPIGTRVDVRSRYVGEWTHGFEIADRVDDGYVVRRLSDDTVLPGVFDEQDIRPERRRQSGFWWY